MEINWKEIEYLWVKEDLMVRGQKSHRIIFLILCDIVYKTQQNVNIKDRNIIFAVSKR